MKRVYLARNVRRVRARRTRPYRTARNIAAARTIQNRYRRYKFRKNLTPAQRAAVDSVGEPRSGRNQCKSAIITDTATANLSLNGSTLYTYDLTGIAQGNEQYQRERSIINVSGFKIKIWFRNFQGSTPCWINCAVIAPKSTTSGDNVSGISFFRNEGGTQRYFDFNGIGATGFQQATRSINNDDYVILWRKRFMLGQQSPGAVNYNEQSGRSSYRLIERYIPLKRQVRYADAESISATDGRVWLVYWQQNPDSLAVAGLPSGSLLVSQKFVTYFREIV